MLIEELLRAAHPRLLERLRRHVTEHLPRFRRVLLALPPGDQGKRLLDVGGTGNLAAAYVNLLEYGFVTVANKWRGDAVDPVHLARHIPAGRFQCDFFDAELDPFPYEDGLFDVAVCSEVIEHLRSDPMHMLAELNRVLRNGGRLILSTPNIASFGSLYRLMAGQHPQIWSIYERDGGRHQREYTALEVRLLLRAAGFEVARTETFSLRPLPVKARLLVGWVVLPWLLRGRLGLGRDRGEFTLAVAVKSGPVVDRYPGWLYGKGEAEASA